MHLVRPIDVLTALGAPNTDFWAQKRLRYHLKKIEAKYGIKVWHNPHTGAHGGGRGYVDIDTLTEYAPEQFDTLKELPENPRAAYWLERRYRRLDH